MVVVVDHTPITPPEMADRVAVANIPVELGEQEPPDKALPGVTLHPLRAEVVVAQALPVKPEELLAQTLAETVAPDHPQQSLALR